MGVIIIIIWMIFLRLEIHVILVSVLGHIWCGEYNQILDVIVLFPFLLSATTVLTVVA